MLGFTLILIIMIIVPVVWICYRYSWVGYVNAPFEYHANNPSGNTKYNCNRIEPLNISSGAKAIVYFLYQEDICRKIDYS